MYQLCETSTCQPITETAPTFDFFAKFSVYNSLRGQLNYKSNKTTEEFALLSSSPIVVTPTEARCCQSPFSSRVAGERSVFFMQSDFDYWGKELSDDEPMEPRHHAWHVGDDASNDMPAAADVELASAASTVFRRSRSMGLDYSLNFTHSPTSITNSPTLSQLSFDDNDFFSDVVVQPVIDHHYQHQHQHQHQQVSAPVLISPWDFSNNTTITQNLSIHDNYNLLDHTGIAPEQMTAELGPSNLALQSRPSSPPPPTATTTTAATEFEQAVLSQNNNFFALSKLHHHDPASIVLSTPYSEFLLESESTSSSETQLPGSNSETASSPANNYHVHQQQQQHAQSSPATILENDVDRNGRRRRVYKKTQFTCSHCPQKFLISDMHTYCQHVIENNIQREFKCPESSCPWSIIGFQRKLEKDRHFTRKHGVPKYECRFWAGPGKEKFSGSKICTTQWHADSGNRTRHERSVHGYYVATQRGKSSSEFSTDMIKVDGKSRKSE
ncbi:hypothetical protein V1514DRAFT_334151 [Lipomyces japonicus]|uniref:uncharacterized protein n=1 Tax=Lipomyces japonicus TaxID=56871 RepID=UPI0034CF7E35